MYRHMSVEFIPIRQTGRALQTNSCLICMALSMICQIHRGVAGWASEHNEGDKQNHGVEPSISADEFIGTTEAWHEATFLKPEKYTETAREKIPLMAAKVMRRLANVAWWGLHHVRVQSALLRIQVFVSMPWKRSHFIWLSSTYVSISREYISLWIFSIIIWKP